MDHVKVSPPPSPPPHVLIFPLPAQGHVNSMLKLAELLAIAGLKITFVNSTHNHNRLIQFTDVLVRFSKYPTFEFKTVPDGLPDDHPRTGNTVFTEMFNGLIVSAKPALRDFIVDIKPDCIIGDGILAGFVLDIGEELEIPVILFRTTGASYLWIVYLTSCLVEAGTIPFRGNEGMYTLVEDVPGMETFLRFRDLPSFFRADNPSVSSLQTVSNETQKASRAHGLILNTFEALEGPSLCHIRTKCPKVFAIGPLHAHLRTRLSDQRPESSSNSLWKVDRSCMSWLGQQQAQSVIYVSFGSVTVMTREELLEVWYGLVNSKRRFLWVVRPDSVVGGGGGEDVPVELREGTEERGCLVEWAPQEEVLAHSAIGGFFTHSGWNSTLESLVEGVPMLCWPYFGDQQVNSRLVEVWKLGLDMKDVCDRKVVEKMVNDLMEEKKEELVGAAKEMSKMAKESVSLGGSSYVNLDRLVDEIRFMNLNKYDF